MKLRGDVTRVIIIDLMSETNKSEDNYQILRDRLRLQDEINLSVIKYNSSEIYKKDLKEKVGLSNSKLLFKKQNPDFKFTKTLIL